MPALEQLALLVAFGANTIGHVVLPHVRPAAHREDAVP